MTFVKHDFVWEVWLDYGVDGSHKLVSWQKVGSCVGLTLVKGLGLFGWHGKCGRGWVIGRVACKEFFVVLSQTGLGIKQWRSWVQIYCYKVAVQSYLSWSLELKLEQRDFGHRLQLIHCAHLQLQSSYFESMQRTEGSGKFQDWGLVAKVSKGPRLRFQEVGTSFRSSKNKSVGQQGLVFQGCTKAWKNTENYYKNISEVRTMFGDASECLGLLGVARGIFLRGYSEFKSKGVE